MHISHLYLAMKPDFPAFGILLVFPQYKRPVSLVEYPAGTPVKVLSLDEVAASRFGATDSAFFNRFRHTILNRSPESTRRLRGRNGVWRHPVSRFSKILSHIPSCVFPFYRDGTRGIGGVKRSRRVCFRVMVQPFILNRIRVILQPTASPHL